jgi:hypothetical protein
VRVGCAEQGLCLQVNICDGLDVHCGVVLQVLRMCNLKSCSASGPCATHMPFPTTVPAARAPSAVDESCLSHAQQLACGVAREVAGVLSV